MKKAQPTDLKPGKGKRSRATGRITLSDVAKAASVSPITASRALRSAESVSPELAQRVNAAANTLGYVPDPAARALASARSTSIVVLVPMLTNALFVEVLEAIHEVVTSTGYQTLIAVTHYDSQQEETLIKSYLAHRPAGFIVSGFDRTEVARRLISSSGLPCVHIMEVASAPGLHSVGFSQTEGGATMTRHLIAQGRKRIVFAAAQLDPRTMQRAEGYRRAMKSAGLYDPKLEVLNPQRSSIALGAELLEQSLRYNPDVDAIFFNNDDLAQGGVLHAQRLGIKVPEQIAIGGFNDLTGSDQMNPPISTIRTPLRQMGTQAAQMLLQLLEGQPVQKPNIDLSFELIVRKSS
jgi:LacI family transcriptional regulator, gluconate utilization system Gnt-I transcriptional repressor